MKNWFKRFIALTMTGAIMAGSATALATDVNATADIAKISPGFDDEDAEGYKDVSITKVENHANELTVYSSIGEGSNYTIRLYISESGGEYVEAEEDVYSTENGYLTCNLSNLTNGKLYSFKLTLLLGDEEVAYSEPVSMCRLDPVEIRYPKTMYIKNGKYTMKWTRNSKATGYLIQYRVGSKKGAKKNVWIRNNRTVSKTLKGLKKGKRYYATIKPYKKVNGKYYYGPSVEHEFN